MKRPDNREQRAVARRHAVGTGLAFVLFLAGSATLSAGSQPWARHTIDHRGLGADGTRLADANGDHLPDIVTGWEEAGEIRLYLNPGPNRASEPWPTVTVGEVASPEDAVLVDLDGDGRVDVVSSCEGGNRTVFVHWAPAPVQILQASRWHTGAMPITQKQQRWMFALPLQIDGQAGVDLVLGSKGEDASIGWLEAPRNARNLDAWRWHPWRAAGWIMSLLARDVDGDGDWDVVASDRKGARRGVFWLENPGPALAASAPWREHFIGARDLEVMFIDVADWDGDGRAEVLAAVKPRSVLCFRSAGNPTAAWVAESFSLPGSLGTAKAVRVADLNLDGRADLIFSCEEAAGDRPGVAWFSRSRHQSGPLEFHEVSGAPGTKFDLIELLDLDADGDLDIITSEEKDGLGVVWYENPTRKKDSP